MTQNVVLIVLDTVRKDTFDRYAPRLERRASTTFDQCRAASSCTVPSHASFMTGELPHQHGVDSFHNDFSRLDRADTFLAALPDHAALGVSANAFAGSPFGFDTLFDQFVDVTWTRRFQRGMDPVEFATKTDAEGLGFYTEFAKEALEHDHPLATVANAVLAQADVSLFSRLPVPTPLDCGTRTLLRRAQRLVEAAEEPFFLFVNLMEAHAPHRNVWGYDQTLHDVPNTWHSIAAIDDWDVLLNGVEPYAEDLANYRKLYAAAVDYLDRTVSAFVDRLLEGTERETTVVVTADHGENLGLPGDGGLFEHKSSLSEGLLHVPLALVNPPPGYPERVDRLFSQLDLGRLLSGLARGETPDVCTERAVAERVGTTIGATVYRPEMTEAERRYWSRLLRCTYDGETKVVWDSLGNATEYELDRERPSWEGPVATDATVPDWSTQYFDVDASTYRARVDGDEPATEVDEFTRSRLEELGYL